MDHQLSPQELWVLSYYQASELAGALFFGRLARRFEDEEVRYHLVQHCAEEARHAALWAETIRETGHYPLRITQTYQSQYVTNIGLPTTLTEILVLTRVFEERIYDHFSAHSRRAELHPAVKKTLERMLKEEEGHLGWIEKKLSENEKEKEYAEILYQRYKEIDKKIYQEVIQYEKKLWEFLNVKP
jgi:rubrerythrin